jgi:hypothetical protein
MGWFDSKLSKQLTASPLSARMGPLILSLEGLSLATDSLTPHLNPPTKTAVSCWVSKGFSSLCYAVDHTSESTAVRTTEKQLYTKLSPKKSTKTTFPHFLLISFLLYCPGGVGQTLKEWHFLFLRCILIIIIQKLFFIDS